MQLTEFVHNVYLPKKLYSLNLRSLTGIGASTYTRLISNGINSVESLCNKDASTLKKAFGWDVK